MMQSSVRELEFLRNVLTDVKRQGSVLGTTVESFYTHVERRVKTRGFHELLLVDFPDLGKVYDQALSSGSLNLTAIPLAFGKLHDVGRFQDSWIFRTLLHATIDGFGQHDVTCTPEDVAFTRQILYLYKKAVIDCPERRVHDAVQEFVSIERELRAPDGSWDSDLWFTPKVSFAGSFPTNWSGSRWRHYWHALDWACRLCTPQVPLLGLDIKPKHGPGSVSDLRRGGDKYIFPFWPEKLEGLFPLAQFGCANEYLFHTEGGPGSSPKEPPVKLLAVPKTYKGPRLIASEPTAHQYIQQGIMRWLRDHLPRDLRHSVNFADQRPSREAALESSSTGVGATVDLSSASDRLSCWVVERAFRSNQTILKHLHSARSRVLVDGTGTDPELSIKLRKFAAQGAAFTFPVQTIIYAAVAIAAVVVESGWTLRKSNFTRAARLVRVFGDDIILPSSSVPLLTAALTALQLKVNRAKTHWAGRFRESCGMDAYASTDVTPCYVRYLEPPSTLSSVPSWVDVSNTFHKAGYWVTSSWMLDQVPCSALRAILTSSEEGGGIRAFTFCRGYRSSNSRRWNKDLHRQEVKALTSTSREVKLEREGSGCVQNLLQYFLEEPDPETNWSSGYLVRNRDKVTSRWVSP